MIKYAAFLRGINVGGHKLIKMEDLRSLFERLGFANVATYIQSGNVIFETAERAAESLSRNIEAKLLESLGFEVKVITRTIAALEKIAAHKFLAEAKLIEGAKIYVAFLSAAPIEEKKHALAKLQNDFESFLVDDGEAYILLKPGNPRKEIFSNNFLEKTLNVAATTRNITTINKILNLHRGQP